MRMVLQVYQWCGFKSCRGKNKNLTALKSNSNTVWFNFETCNPCFSTFDQIFCFVSWIKNSFFFVIHWSLILFVTQIDVFYLWLQFVRRGRHTFLRAKTNFNWYFYTPCNEVVRGGGVCWFHHVRPSVDESCVVR